MPSFYSEDLRNAVVKAYSTGKWTQQEVADTFSIHLSTFKNIWRKYKDTGDCKVDSRTFGRKPAIEQAGFEIIKNFILENTDATFKELIAFYQKKCNVKLSLSMAHRALQKLNLNRKKKSLFAAEQEREDVKKKIAALENDGKTRT